MTTSKSKGRFFLQNESIRIDSHNESNRIDSNCELECSNKHSSVKVFYAIYCLRFTITQYPGSSDAVSIKASWKTKVWNLCETLIMKTLINRMKYSWCYALCFSFLRYCLKLSNAKFNVTIKVIKSLSVSVKSNEIASATPLAIALMLY